MSMDMLRLAVLMLLPAVLATIVVGVWLALQPDQLAVRPSWPSLERGYIDKR